jgi:prepilin-type N-terminal cleavage/methylation domain-containing protein
MKLIQGFGTPMRDERGFTLLEFLVTVSIFCIVLSSVYMVHETNKASYSRSEMRMDIQQNARVALATMEKELRMAGYGVPNAAGTLTLPRIIEARPRTITFRVDLRNVITTLTSHAAAGANTLILSATTDIAAGDVIYVTNGAKAEALTVQNVNSGTLTVTTTTNLVNSYLSGSRVYVPRDVRYTVTGGQLLRAERTANGTWPSADTVLADRILDQNTFRYYNALNTEITSNNPVVSPDDNIRRIRITLIASGTPSGLDLQTYTLTSDVKPRNL